MNICKFESQLGTMAKNTSNNKSSASGITVVSKLRNYSNDPFVVQKRENAITTIKKHGLPGMSKKK